MSWVCSFCDAEYCAGADGSDPGCPACDGNGPDARLMASAAALKWLVEAVAPVLEGGACDADFVSAAVECARAAIASCEKATAEEVKP